MSTQSPSTWTDGNSDFPIVHLRDNEGREVQIAPAAGFNAFSFCVPKDGQNLEILIQPKDDAALKRGGFSFGNPLLFPLPNRVRDGNYTFEGQNYKLDVNFKDGHAIHGLVCDRPWTLTETGADEQRGAWATATFDIRQFPDALRQYPFEFVATATYSLHQGALRLSFSAQNVGERDLPMGFGIHPWFPFPFTDKGQRVDCRLKLPANARWELESSTQLIPTGEITPVEGGEYDFREERALGTLFMDDVYTSLTFDGDVHRSHIHDSASGVTLSVEASNSFREYVVYAPLDRNVICLEPYTSTTNAVNLNNEGIDAGLVVLQPGQSWQGDISIAVTTN
jgi:aldose 1-epimerase